MECNPSKLKEEKKFLLSKLRRSTTLPCLTLWEKEKLLKELARRIVSWTRWSKDDNSISPLRRALISISESPLKWDWCKPISWIKLIARLAVISSRTSTECGFCIFSAIAAITCSSEFRTTIPIPALSFSLNIVPSKFVLNSPGLGGSHVCFLAIFGRIGVTQLAVKSRRNFFATALMLLLDKVCSFSLALFLWVQMNHAVVAKISRYRVPK